MPNNRIGVEMKEKCENEENGLAMGEERLDFSCPSISNYFSFFIFSKQI